VSDLSAVRIAAELARRGARLGPISVLEQTASTNDDARALARGGAPHGAVVLAEAQSAGRGRGTHRWYSPPGASIYASLVWRPRLESSRLAMLALAVGVGVARGVDAHLSVPRARIKWPNDVYVDDRKIAGILVEASLGSGAPLAIVGVGLNVGVREFPTDLATIATSLLLAGGRDLDRSLVAATLLASVDDACRDLEAGLSSDDVTRSSRVLEELGERDCLIGRAVRIGEVVGAAAGIDTEGRLLVRRADGVLEAVVSGEVSLEVGGR